MACECGALLVRDVVTDGGRELTLENCWALEVVAWQFKGITEALFALRDRMGGSPNADEGKR
jgi:hypothetical protein